MSAPAHIARENGKKGGRPKGALSIHVEKAKELLIKMYLERAKPINEALIKKAEEGDIGALRELHDRVYGKSSQAIEFNGQLNISNLLNEEERD